MSEIHSQYSSEEHMRIPPVPALIRFSGSQRTSPVGDMSMQCMDIATSACAADQMDDSDREVNHISRHGEPQCDFISHLRGHLSDLGSTMDAHTPSSFDSKNSPAAMSDSSDSSEADSREHPVSGNACDQTVKPRESFIAMITMAIRSSPQGKATLSQIYEYIRENFPFYGSDGSNWQNSIRHNLSLNDCFKREARKSNDPGKGSYWVIDPIYGDMFKNSYCERRKKRVKKIPKRPRTNRLAAAMKSPIAQECLRTASATSGYASSVATPSKVLRFANADESRLQHRPSTSSSTTPLTPPCSPPQQLFTTVSRTASPPQATINQPATMFQFPAGAQVAGMPVTMAAPTQGSPYSISSMVSSSPTSQHSGPSASAATPPMTVYRLVPASTFLTQPTWPATTMAFPRVINPLAQAVPITVFPQTIPIQPVPTTSH